MQCRPSPNRIREDWINQICFDNKLNDSLSGLILSFLPHVCTGRKIYSFQYDSQEARFEFSSHYCYLWFSDRAYLQFIPFPEFVHPGELKLVENDMAGTQRGIRATIRFCFGEDVWNVVTWITGEHELAAVDQKTAVHVVDLDSETIMHSVSLRNEFLPKTPSQLPWFETMDIVEHWLFCFHRASKNNSFMVLDIDDYLMNASSSPDGPLPLQCYKLKIPPAVLYPCTQAGKLWIWNTDGLHFLPLSLFVQRTRKYQEKETVINDNPICVAKDLPMPSKMLSYDQWLYLISEKRVDCYSFAGTHLSSWSCENGFEAYMIPTGEMIEIVPHATLKDCRVVSVFT